VKCNTNFVRAYLCGNNLGDWLSAGFQRVLKTHHIEISETLEDADALLVINWSPKFNKLLRRARRAKKFTFLVVTEPAVVIAQHGMNPFKAKFSSVIEIGRARGAQTILYFQESNLKYFDRPLEERWSRTVAVSANKSSFLKGELYGLRRRVYNLEPDLDVYGKDWDKGYLWTSAMAAKQFLSAVRSPHRLSMRSLPQVLVNPKNNLGEVENKLEAMSRYRQALVIENSSEYMSEKLVDAFCAGCIPIYVGASPHDFEIPANLVVSCSPKIESVQSGIKKAMSLDYAIWKTQVRDWLSNPEVLHRRKSVEVMAEVAERINLELKLEAGQRRPSRLGGKRDW